MLRESFLVVKVTHLLHFVLAKTPQSLLLLQLVAHLGHPVARLSQRQRTLGALRQTGGKQRLPGTHHAAAVQDEDTREIYYKVTALYEIDQSAGLSLSRCWFLG